MTNLLGKFKGMHIYFKGVLGDLYSPVLVFLQILGIILLAIFIAKIGSYIIKKVFEKQKTFKYSIDSKRMDTMATLSVSIFRYAVYIISAVTILSDVLKLNSVLAAAGIGGVAVGLGAQSLIKDIISGFFIVLEDQYVVGDLITVDTMNGVVEELELRVTKIRNFNGDLYVIPNGEIKKVTNHTRGNKSATVDIPLAYGTDLNKAIEIANGVCCQVTEEFQTIVEPPKVLGITEFGKDSVNMRIQAKTQPNEQWELERRIRFLIKEQFAKENIDFRDRNVTVIDSKAIGGGEKIG